MASEVSVYSYGTEGGISGHNRPNYFLPLRYYDSRDAYIRTYEEGEEEEEEKVFFRSFFLSFLFSRSHLICSWRLDLAN